MPQLPTLLIQIVIILATARGIGWLFRMIRQPQVVGEMVAGILLGPSLLGWLMPGVSAALFPPASLSLLNALSQVGLIVFMFLVGLEFKPQNLKGKEHTAIVTSHASIIAPFLLDWIGSVARKRIRCGIGCQCLMKLRALREQRNGASHSPNNFHLTRRTPAVNVPS